MNEIWAKIVQMTGAAGVLAFFLWLIIKWLLNHCDKLLCKMENMSKVFAETMNNHLETNTKAINQLSVCIKDLKRELSNKKN